MNTNKSKPEWMNIPNLLSGFRLIAAPFLLLIAWSGYPGWFFALLIIMFMTDAIDGFVARKLNIASELGTRLDSWGDMATYLIIPICAWWLWPEIIRREAFFVFIAVLCYIVPLAAGFIKFKRLPSYHTWSAKAAAVLMSSCVILLFGVDMPWPFRFAVIFQVFVTCESVAITLRLSRWQCNIPSYWHLTRISHEENKKT